MSGALAHPLLASVAALPEFHQALQMLAGRDQPQHDAHVLPLVRPPRRGLGRKPRRSIPRRLNVAAAAVSKGLHASSSFPLPAMSDRPISADLVVEDNTGLAAHIADFLERGAAGHQGDGNVCAVKNEAAGSCEESVAEGRLISHSRRIF